MFPLKVESTYKNVLNRLKQTEKPQYHFLTANISMNNLFSIVNFCMQNIQNAFMEAIRLR